MSDRIRGGQARASLVDYVRVVRPAITDTLVPSAQMERLEALARALPPCPLAGFECRLGSGDRRTDLQVQLPNSAFPLARSLVRRTAWTFIHDLHREWLDETSSLSVHVSAVGVECDVNGRSAVVPSLFVALRPPIGIEADGVTRVASRMLGSPPPALLSRLGACVDALPAGAAIRFLGAMLSRPSGALRMNITGLAADGLADYLRDVGWTHPMAPLTALLSTVEGLVDAVVLCLDLTDEILPRIGVECVLDAQPPTEPRWGALLDRLVDGDLATSADRQALFDWHGCTPRPSDSGYWPESLRLADHVLRSDAVSVFYRYLSHLKFIYRPGGHLSAKAYLGFAHRWIDPAPAARPRVAPKRVTDASPSEHLQRVRSYWEETTHLYLEQGTTFQAGHFIHPTPADRPRSNNLLLAARAGISPGQHVLDAGCGVCGPSIDLASSIDSLTLDAVTLSPRQATIAASAIRAAGLGDRVRVHVGDYHQLPFGDSAFDVVFFFESLLYSPDLRGLFTEVHRVLRPGGRLYAKELFREARQLSAQEERAVAEFEDVFLYPARTMNETAASAMAAGFCEIETENLSPRITTEPYDRAAVEYQFGTRVLTEFGKRHARECNRVPILFGDLRARKPAVRS